MQNESKGVYVQMPKPDNDQAVKLLADLVNKIDESDLAMDREILSTVYAAKEYLERNGIVTSEKELILSEATV